MLFKNALAVLVFTLAATPAAAETIVSSTGADPSLALLPKGGFIVVWSGIDDGAGSVGVFARLYDSRGRLKQPELRVNAEVFGDQQSPTVAADGAGSFAVAWTGGAVIPGTDNWPGGDGDRTGVYVQRFDRSGRRLGRQIQVNRSTSGNQLWPAVAMAPDGSFVVAWQDCPAGSPCGVKAQRFSASGARKGEERAMDAAGLPHGMPFAVADPEGFSVGWTELGPVQSSIKSEASPAVARFTPEGRPASAPIFRLFDGVADATGWSLAGLASSGAGSVALLSGKRNSVQLFTPDGELAGPRRIVGKRAPCREGSGWCELAFTAAMNSTGHFAVIWFVNRATSPGGATRYDLMAQFFEPSGEPVGDRFLVNRDYDGLVSASGLAAVLSDEGVLTVAWSGRELASGEHRLVFRQLRMD